MPEIIRRGKTREEKVIGLEFTCFGCHTVFRLVAGDEYRYKEAQEQRDNDLVYLDCPVCGRECTAVPPGTGIY